MIFDMHIHSTFSIDGTATPAEIIKYAQKKQLSGIAIADHNTIKGALDGLHFIKEHTLKDFVFIPAVEVSSDSGHILALNVTHDIPSKLTPAETIEKIHDAGGIAIAAHPCRFLGNNLSKNDIRTAPFDGIETFNARFILPYGNKKALALGQELGYGQTGGSDAHHLEAVGYGITEVAVDSTRPDDILQEILKKRTKAYGTRVPLPIIAKERILDAYLLLKNGMKRV